MHDDPGNPPLEPVSAPAPADLTDRVLLGLVRRAVLDHATAEQRRTYPPVVHVGVPGAKVARLELGDQRLDHALRTDVLLAMVRRTRRSGPPPLVWLTRPGSLDVRDVDVAWSSAARTAAAELGRTLPMVVVNRRSWVDPATGVGRDWQRLRAP